MSYNRSRSTITFYYFIKDIQLKRIQEVKNYGILTII